MYLHIGGDAAVPARDIVGVFDIDNCTQARDSRDFLAAAERGGRAVTVCDDLPRSFVLTEKDGRETVYISRISPVTIKKRAEAGARAFSDPSADALEG